MKKKSCILFLLIMMLFSFIPNKSVFAANATSNLEMVVKSGSYSYSTKSALSKYRKDYFNFGEEIDVISIVGDWVKIDNEGKTQYILKKNVDYKKNTVIKNRIMVSKGAYACSSSSTLGYLFYGTEVSVIEEVKGKNGNTYVHVLIDETYTSDGKSIKKKNVEGYINKIYLEESNIPKVVDVTTNLYSSAFGTTATNAQKQPVGKIYMGEQVQVLMSNKTWSKVLYNDQEYYVYTNKLSDLKLQVLVNRVIQTYDAKPGSGSLHYVYWNTPITVLNEYHSDIYGKYYYCKISGDYGFIREYSNSGIQYIGYQTQMITNSRVNLYQKPDDTSNKIMSIDTKEELTILYQNDTWSYVNYNGNNGYVLTDKLEYEQYHANGNTYSSGYKLYKNNATGSINDNVELIAKKEKYGYAYVKDSSSNKFWMKLNSLTQVENQVNYTIQPFTILHMEASNDSNEITIPYMSEVETIGYVSNSNNGGWMKLKYNDSYYYLWMNMNETYFTSVKHSMNYSYDTEYEKDVIEKALYIYNNWETKYEHEMSNGIIDSDGKYGFDCSGFVTYVLDIAMREYVPTYNLTANLQKLYELDSIYNQGYSGELVVETILDETIDFNKLKAGDLIYFDTDLNDSVDHVGMYLGNKEFIHCSSTWDGKLTIMPLTHYYEEKFVSTKRYLPVAIEPSNEILVANEYTKMYSEQSSESSVLVTINPGDKIQLYYTNNGNWAYAKCKDYIGFILINKFVK